MATTSNPVLARATFAPTGELGTTPMTLGGTIAKTLVLLGILATTATFSWLQAGAGWPSPTSLAHCSWSASSVASASRFTRSFALSTRRSPLRSMPPSKACC